MEVAVGDANNSDDIVSAEIKLEKHVHTLLCERSERVCTAMGKFREGESLTLHVVRKSGKMSRCTNRCAWYRRRNTNWEIIYDDAFSTSEGNVKIINGMGNSAQHFSKSKYVIRPIDADCYIKGIFYSLKPDIDVKTSAFYSLELHFL